MPDIIAIGGGQASFSFISKLRSLGYQKPISLICGENHIPYQRPPLSKKFLIGELEKDRLFFKPQGFYDEQNIEVIKGQIVKKIDRRQSKIILDNEKVLNYKTLFLGLGSRSRLLPKNLSNGIPKLYYIREIGDISLITKEFRYKRKLIILGGGFIGLEVASVARNFGVDVTILESQERILKRTSAKIVANHIKKIHLLNGVFIKENTNIKKFLKTKNNSIRILTNKNEELLADFMIAGIGAQPNTEIADNAGLLVDNGIVVDENCRTSDPNIFAAGDCVSFPFNKDLIRLENVGNAIEQSEAASENVLGKDIKYQPVPWFWSDQFDIKLQIAGLNKGFTKVFHRQSDQKNSFWYYKDDQLISVEAINDPKSYMVGKKLLEMKKTPSPQDIVSNKINLKDMLREIK